MKKEKAFWYRFPEETGQCRGRRVLAWRHGKNFVIHRGLDDQKKIWRLTHRWTGNRIKEASSRKMISLWAFIFEALPFPYEKRTRKDFRDGFLLAPQWAKDYARLASKIL